MFEGLLVGGQLDGKDPAEGGKENKEHRKKKRAAANGARLLLSAAYQRNTRIHSSAAECLFL